MQTQKKHGPDMRSLLLTSPSRKRKRLIAIWRGASHTVDEMIEKDGDLVLPLIIGPGLHLGTNNPHLNLGIADLSPLLRGSQTTPRS